MFVALVQARPKKAASRDGGNELHRHHPHQLLMLLLFVASLQSCWSAAEFRPSRLFPAVIAARRSASTGEPGRWRKMDPKNPLSNWVMNIAAKRANVEATYVLEAFYKDGYRPYGVSLKPTVIQ